MKPRAPSEAIQWIHLSTWVSGGHFVRRIPEPHLHHHRSRVATKVGKKKNASSTAFWAEVNFAWEWLGYVGSPVNFWTFTFQNAAYGSRFHPPYHSFFRGRVMWRWLKIYPTSTLLSQWDFYNKNKSLRATKLNKWHDSLPTSKKTPTFWWYQWYVPRAICGDEHLLFASLA